MKHLLVLFLGLLSTTIYAQNNIEKTVGEFKTLKVYDLINVELIKSDQDRVVISGKNKNDVVINNKNGTLKIKMSLEESFDGNTTNVKLYYTNVDVIDANEGSKITSKNTIEQFEIDLNAQEGAKINVSVAVTYLNIRAVTGANVEASGVTKNQDVSIYTGGEYHGKQLKSEYTEVSIRAAGKAEVFTTEKAIAKVRAGGSISIYGNPKDVEESKILGGSILRIKS
jgi:hypothetical protein